MGGGAGHLEPQGQHSLCLDSDVEVGRLAGHGEVPVVAVLDEEVRAAVDFLLGLLVGHDREDDVHTPLLAELLDGAHHRGERALHVVGAPAVQPVSLDAGGELLDAARDNVEVSVEHDSRGPRRAHGCREQRQPPDLELVDLDIACLEPALDEPGSLLDALLPALELETVLLNLAPEDLQQLPARIFGAGLDLGLPELAVGPVESALGKQVGLGELLEFAQNGGVVDHESNPPRLCSVPSRMAIAAHARNHDRALAR